MRKGTKRAADAPAQSKIVKHVVDVPAQSKVVKQWDDTYITVQAGIFLSLMFFVGKKIPLCPATL